MSFTGDYNWVGGNGLFSNGANWVSALNGKKGKVPGPSDLAAIQSDATISGNGSVGQLNIEDGATNTHVTLTGKVTTKGLFIDNGASLTLSSSLAKMTVTSNFTVNPSASLIVTNSGSLTAKGINCELGSSLSVSGGAKINCSSYIVGQIVSVDGAGTTVTSVGFSASSLTLTGGASIIDKGTGDIEGGTSVISGGAKFSTTSDLTVGTCTFSSGARVTAGGNLFAYVTGTVLTIESGAKLAAAAAVFNNRTTIAGTGSALTIKGLATIGDFAAVTITVESGGHFQAGSANLGSAAQNWLVVTGQGSSAIVTGKLDVGRSGLGSLLVEAKGSAQAGALTVGDKAGTSSKSVGRVIVTGAGSTLTARGAFTLGADGTGDLTISAGGALVADGIFEAGALHGGVGAGIVTGAHSSLQYASTLVIGALGSGALSVEAGGVVAAKKGGPGTIEIGASAGGNGSVVVGGTGSMLEGTLLAIGGTGLAAGGTGRITVDTGGAVLVKRVDVWGHGEAVLGGGRLSAASVTIAAGGLVSGEGAVSGAINNRGAIDAQGGVLDVKGAVSGTGGALNIAAGATLEFESSVASSQKLTFGGHDSLMLTDPSAFAAAIAGFAKGDGLDLTTFGSGTKISFKENAAKTQGTLTISQGAQHASLTLLGQFVAAGFAVGSDHHSGSLITYSPPAATMTPLLTADH
jgi:T5SS/PEP-CTERM-associated repeat protein